MNKRLHRTLSAGLAAGALIALLVVLLAAGCAKDKASKADEKSAELAIPVVTVTAGEGQSGGEIILTGSLEPRNMTPIGTQEGGTVRAIYVEVGDRVKRGQPLASLDLSDFQFGAQQADAALEAAKVAFETAEKDYQRFENLHKDGSISPSDFDKATLGYKAAKAQVRQAEAMRGLAHNRLGNAVIRAPFDGQVTQRLVNLGSFVDAMTHPVMFVMVDSARLRVTLKLPEARAALLAPGDGVKVRLPSLNRELTTKIEVMTDAVDPMSHTRTAVAWIDNQGPDALPAGIFFDARILPGALAGKVLLPSSSVREEADGKVYTYLAQGGKAARKQITGRFLGDHSEFVVDSGVAKGDKVIVDASMVREGQAITLGEAAPAAAKPEETKK
jgi:RND family efflux transporter MFP subunit